MSDFVVRCDFRPQKVAILFRTSYIVAGEIPYPVSVAHGGTGSTNAAGARTALGALGASDIANNLTTDTEGKVLDARQGKTLKDAVDAKINTADIANNLTTTASGKVLDARQGKSLKDAVDAKVNTSDIIDDLVSTDTDKPLSANQGKVLADRVTPIANGGTGASTVANARTNLSVYSKTETDSAIQQSTADKAFGGYIDESTWSALWTNCLSKITQSQIGFVGLFSDSAASVLSNGKITSLVGVTIYRGGSDSSRTFRVMAMSGNGQYQYSWQITSATSSSRTTGTVYRFTGTAL